MLLTWEANTVCEEQNSWSLKMAKVGHEILSKLLQHLLFCKVDITNLCSTKMFMEFNLHKTFEIFSRKAA